MDADKKGHIRQVPHELTILCAKDSIAGTSLLLTNKIRTPAKYAVLT